MKCLSLFSGVGGFDLAAENCGHQIVAACEIDKNARSVYTRHFPKVPLYTDATKINPKELPDFDVITAGFPCQAFSLAGKRLGFEESRGTLFFEIARIARQKRPGLLLFENVKGLLSHDYGKTFKTILKTIDELGYDAQWQVLNSKYWVPQNRERIYIVGNLRDRPRPKVFPLSEGSGIINGTRRTPPKEGQRIQSARTIDANYHKGGGTRTMIQTGHIGKNRMAERIYSPDGISRAITSSGGGQGAKTGLYEVKPVLTPHRKNKGQNGRRIKDNGGPSFILTTQDQQGVAVRPVMNLGYHKIDCGRCIKPPGAPSHTLKTRSDKLGVMVGAKIRSLTPLECERLQGFPDNFTKFGKNNEIISDTQRYKMMGNAITVPVVRDIMQRLE